MSARVTLGRVTGVFGVRGWVRVQSHTRPVDNLLQYPVWTLQGPEAFASSWSEARVQGGTVVAQLREADGSLIENRDRAARLIGCDIQVTRAEMPEPEPGQYYWSDLTGLRVLNAEGVELGQVDHLIHNGAQDVLVVVSATGRRLIPFVQGAIVLGVDLPGQSLTVDWQPEW